MIALDSTPSGPSQVRTGVRLATVALPATLRRFAEWCTAVDEHATSTVANASQATGRATAVTRPASWARRSARRRGKVLECADPASSLSLNRSLPDGESTGSDHPPQGGPAEQPPPGSSARSSPRTPTIHGDLRHQVARHRHHRRRRPCGARDPRGPPTRSSLLGLCAVFFGVVRCDRSRSAVATPTPCAAPLCMPTMPADMPADSSVRSRCRRAIS
jgi:hypothetical protein